ncbi:MAG: flagellar motor protein MotD [Burkholderiaceae bacterium]|nr:flagellar motor protein MotD [Burkholderiaceae bacterium]
MARKHREEDHENHERWMVSYADFITLLFAFFVVMYAISSVNTGKYKVLSDALGSAFGRAEPVIKSSDAVSISTQERQFSEQRRMLAIRREKDQMTDMARDILKALAPLVRQDKVRVTQTSRGINVEISASVLFASGDARLTPLSENALKAVAAVLRNDKHAIQVEGHTDNVPIKNSAFPSNWELSAVRAGSVVRLFADNGIDQGRMIAVGHGSNQPVDSNDSAEGRARNRRVEVMILTGVPDVGKDVPLAARGK